MPFFLRAEQGLIFFYGIFSWTRIVLGQYRQKLGTSGKSFSVDHGGPERSWSTTQHHGPAGAPGPPLDHLDPTWSTSCNHTPEIAVQGGSR